MSVVLVIRPDGEKTLLTLSKESPLTIGRMATNEITIPDAEVSLLECRISWNRKGYEVTPATPKGVLINGRRQQAHLLVQGDHLQVGATRICFLEDAALARQILHGKAALPTPEEVAQRVPHPVKQSTEKSTFRPLVPPAPPSHDQLDVVASSEDIPATGTATLSQPDLDEQVQQALARWGVQAKRPGEEDLLRSPLVVTLTTGTVVLLLAMLTLWFVIGRNVTQKSYQTALDDFEQQRFSQAIGRFEEFLKQNPGHSLTSPAQNTLGLARIEQAISGATPDWNKGISLLDDFTRTRRKAPEYPQLIPKLAAISERMAYGAADAAAKQKTRQLLPIAEQAQQRLQLFYPVDQQPTETLAKISTSIRQAENALLKHETLQVALQEMDQGLQAKQPFTVFESRRKLLLRYADLATDKTIRERLSTALSDEKALVAFHDLDHPAVTTEAPPAWPTRPLTLARLTRTRIDLESAGTLVVTVASGSCFAADSVTGQIAWKRVLGEPQPFAPVRLRLETECLLAWDVPHQTLLLLRQRDGALVWQQPLSAVPVAAPLVHAGQVFLPLAQGRLLQLDAVSGKQLGELVFSQPLSSTPAVTQAGDRLLVVGERGVLYSVSYRPLACVAVTYTGHAVQACVAPPLSLGNFVLLAVNDRRDSAELQLWNNVGPDLPLTRIAASRVTGQVRDPAILRGKQLIVPAHPERLAAFTVSESKDQSALTLIAQHQVEPPQGGPIYPVLGPDDELWMTSSKVRRFQLTREAIVAQGTPLSLGIAAQPIEVLGTTLFVSGRSPAHSATTWLAAQRQQMTTEWQVTLGGRALASNPTPAADGTQAVVLDTGEVFNLSATKLQAGGIESRTITALPIPGGLTQPPGAASIDGGRLAVWCGAPEPHLWLLNADGVLTKDLKLAQPLSAAPVPLAGGLLLAVPGRLRLVEAPGFSQPVEDYLLPLQANAPQAWRGCLALEDRLAVALTATGRVIRLQVRSEPVPHLAEVAVAELGEAVSVAPVASGGRLYVATHQSLQCLDAVTLEVLAKIPLAHPLSRSPVLVGDLLALEFSVGNQTTAELLELLPPCKSRGKWQATAARLVGVDRLPEQQAILVWSHGQLTRCSLTDNRELATLDLGQTLVAGPWNIAGEWCVCAADGAILPLKAWRDQQP